MNRLHSQGPSRTATLVASLVLFLVGSNNCLLGAWAGDRSMACMTLPKAVVAAHACCHGTPTAKTPAKAPAKPSCCPDPAVMPSAFAAQKDDAVSAAPMVPSLAAVSTTVPVVVSSRYGGPVAPNESPPASQSRAPSPARAPPLA